MPTDDGTVTRVGISNIQFYIPQGISTHEDCPFDADDEFEVRTLDGAGLLLTPSDDVTLNDVRESLDDHPDADLEPDHA